MTNVLTPSNLFAEAPVLECDSCGRNILGTLAAGDRNRTNAIVIVLERYPRASTSAGEQILAVGVCCKGNCDERLKRNLRSKHPQSMDVWYDLDDLLIPIRYLRAWTGFVNGLCRGNQYTEEARKEYLEILLKTAPFVMREMTPGEEEIQKRLSELDELGF